MQRKPKSNKSASTGQAFTAVDVRLMLSNPVYAYGINLLPAERVAEEVLRLNVQLAQEMKKTGTTYTLADLHERFQTLMKQLEDSGICRRGDPVPTIITKEQWLQAQLTTIQKLARGETL